MRKIKFRAWDRKWNRIIHNSEIEDNEDIIISSNCGKISICRFENGKPIVLKIMQYTGLKDKNGKEIYEGDIVIYCDWYPKEVVYGDEECQCIGFSLKNTMKALYQYDTEDLEVVGNIYENPELLKRN